MKSIFTRVSRHRLVWLSVLSVCFLAACSANQSETDTKQPRALTQGEAERLGVSRFRNYDAGVREIDLIIPPANGQERLQLVGWIDFVNHLGYVSVSEGDEGLAISTGNVVWNGSALAIAPPTSKEAGQLPQADLGTQSWTTTTLDGQTSALTASLLFLLSLGSDRPENSVLLAQSDAAWLRSTEVSGHSVDVFAAPSSTSSAADSPEASPASTPTTPPISLSEIDFSNRILWSVDDTGLPWQVDFSLSLVRAKLIFGEVTPAESQVDLSAINNILGGEVSSDN